MRRSGLSEQQKQAIVDSASQRLSEAIDASQQSRLYILIDPTLQDPLAQNSSRRKFESVAVQLLMPSLDRNKWPYLLIVDKAWQHNAFVRNSLRAAVDEAAHVKAPFPRSVCAWLVGATSDRLELAHGLAKAGVVPDAAGRRRLIRYWDPRTVFAMSGNDVLRRRLPSAFGSCDWYSFNSRLEFAHVEQQARSTGVAHPLTQQEQALFRRLSIINAATGEIVEDSKNPLEPPSREQLEIALSAAEAHGLSDDRDIARFIADRHLAAVPIEHAELLMPVLELCRKGRSSYRALTAAWDRSDWEGVTAQIKQNRLIAERSPECTERVET